MSIYFRLLLLVTLSTTLITPIIVTAPALADSVVTAPFTWQDEKWCPTYRGDNGCDNVQTDNNSSAEFYPSQVTTSNGQIWLKMNSNATETGAFNTETNETWNTPTTFAERINLPCNSSGQIVNWPGFWMVTTGSWPKGGEIDVVEGLQGKAAWHYHYLNSKGVNSAIGGTPSGFNGCGTHTYKVKWESSSITFYYDRKLVGQVTQSQIGVPIANGPMYVINDFMASSKYGGPTVGGTTMKVISFYRKT